MDNNINKLRKERNKSIDDLATYVGIEPKTLYDYESGKVNIPSSRLIKIAEYLNVSIDEILGFSAAPTEEHTYIINEKEYKIIQAARSTPLSEDAVADIIKNIAKYIVNDKKD